MNMRGLTLWRRALRDPRRILRRLALAADVLFARAQASYSQLGEDRVLAALLEGTARGYYVDIGAHHPTRYSNTAALYKSGWHGIDVDARPGTARLFRRQRPRDRALEVGVASRVGRLKFFIFDDEAVNTFSPEWASIQEGTFNRRLLRTVEVPILTLAQLLETHLPTGQEIDLMNVDVEGFDLEVLQSNDWGRFRPRFIVAEDADIQTLDRICDSSLVQFLMAQGYHPVAKTSVSVFFRSSVGTPR